MFLEKDDVFISSNDEQDDDNDIKMDCSTTEEDNSKENQSLNDDHLLPLNESSLSSTTTSSAARVISVCEIQPSFYLTTPIRRLFDPSTDQSTPQDSLPSASSIEYKTPNCHTPSLNDYQHLEYSDNDDENNKENSHYISTLTPITSSTIEHSNPPEVKKFSIYKLILRNPLYK